MSCVVRKIVEPPAASSVMISRSSRAERGSRPRGLVEEEDARVVEQRASQQQALAHPGREALDLALGDAREAYALEHLRAPAPRHPVEGAEEVEVLLGGRPLVDVGRLGDQVDLPRTASSSRGISCPSTRALPPVGCARPVRILIIVDFPAPLCPRSPKTSPRGDLEADAVERPDIAVVLYETLDFDRPARRRGAGGVGVILVSVGMVGEGFQHYASSGRLPEVLLAYSRDAHAARSFDTPAAGALTTS